MKREKRTLPVAVLDSGIGGISVLKEIVKIMPEEDCIFFGDSINAPYGTKNYEDIEKIVLDRAEYLYSKGIKAMVIACNTATSVAINTLREKYTDIPVIGIEPALKPAVCEVTGEKPRVIVMATPMTIHEEKFKKLLLNYKDKGIIYPVPCPGLADLIEAGEVNSLKLEKYILELLRPYMDCKIDCIVLGCTHYPFAAQVIKKVVGDEVKILDGSEGTARQLKRQLEIMNLNAPANKLGKVVFENSIPQKIEVCKNLFKKDCIH